MLRWLEVFIVLCTWSRCMQHPALPPIFAVIFNVRDTAVNLLHTASRRVAVRIIIQLARKEMEDQDPITAPQPLEKVLLLQCCSTSTVINSKQLSTHHQNILTFADNKESTWIDASSNFVPFQKFPVPSRIKFYAYVYWPMSNSYRAILVHIIPVQITCITMQEKYGINTCALSSADFFTTSCRSSNYKPMWLQTLCVLPITATIRLSITPPLVLDSLIGPLDFAFNNRLLRVDYSNDQYRAKCMYCRRWEVGYKECYSICHQRFGKTTRHN